MSNSECNSDITRANTLGDRRRDQQIEAGKIWQVYLAGDDRHEPAILFEGCKTGARAYVAQNFGMSEWRKGNVRIGKLLWEAA